MAESNPSIASFVARETEPKLANNFLQGDNPGVVMTAAEVKFLLAEATLKEWTSGKGTVEALYRQGVRAAMDFLSDNYGCEVVTEQEFEDYISANGIGYTFDQKKKLSTPRLGCTILQTRLKPGPTSDALIIHV